MAGKEKGNLRSGAREEGGHVQPVMQASWQFACLLFTAKCIGALLKKTDVPYSNANFKV